MPSVVTQSDENGIPSGGEAEGGTVGHHNVKVFCTCEGVVVAVSAKPEHEKCEYSVTETEILRSDFGESIRRSNFEVKWDGFQ